MKFGVAKLAAVSKAPKIKDRWGTEIKQEAGRLTGVTPKLLKSYQESPARFLKRSGSLRVGAGQNVKAHA